MTTDAIYEKATDAIERQNYGYAIELLAHVVEADPGNVKARQLLWLAERRQFSADPSAAKSAKFKTIGPWVASLVHSMMGKYDKVIADCERYLRINPENAAMRDQLGKAALQAGKTDLAIAAFESAYEVDSKNIAALRQLGRLYKGKFVESGAREDLNTAMHRFEEILKQYPADHEANSEAKWLAAQRAIEDGGWDTAKNARELIANKDEAQALEESLKVAKGEDEVDKELARMVVAIKAEPTRANLYVRQGDLLLQKKRFKSAEESFSKAHELDPSNTFTRSRLGDVKIAYMKGQIEALREQLAAKPGDAALKAQIDKLAKQLSDFMVQDYRQRVQEQPTNMEVHHDLGLLLYEAGDFEGAMQMFQKSMADPRFRMQANHMLGKCLVEKQMYDRAVNMFKRAVDGVIVMNLTVKAVYYDLGETYEKMGKFTDAEAAYGKIYDADVGYRDISKKMDEVYRKAREKGDDHASPSGAPRK